MRIISGIRRGHKLIEFEGSGIRPTTDRVKESMFNLIMPWIADAAVLDLFSGSGALAFEALSRGAGGAVCVDKDKRSLEVVRKNCESLGFSDRTRLVNADAHEFLKSTHDKFGIIFLDPPYNKGFIEPVLWEIAEYDVLAPDGIAVLESDSTDSHKETDGLEVLKQRKYGRTYVTIYKKKDR